LPEFNQSVHELVAPVEIVILPPDLRVEGADVRRLEKEALCPAGVFLLLVAQVALLPGDLGAFALGFQ